MPTIRGVHEHMSTWMSSLINAQDGCLQMVAHRASMGRSQQEHLAQQVALRSTMPSTNNQVAYLRAQLALRDAQIEQVKAERDNHYVQEEEVLAHMRLLSSEAKDWKSRVVTEAEEVLCRESAQMAQEATEAQEAMDQHYKAKWQQAEADLTALCQSKRSLLPLRCMRRIQNIKSFMMLKRDEFNSRHKPFEKHISMNNKQSRQLRNTSRWYTNFANKQMNSRMFADFYGNSSSPSGRHIKQRSMSSIPNYSICERRQRWSLRWFQAGQSDQSQRMSSILFLQAEVWDGFYLMNSRLRTDQHPQVYNHRLELQFN